MLRESLQSNEFETRYKHELLDRHARDEIPLDNAVGQQARPLYHRKSTTPSISPKRPQHLRIQSSGKTLRRHQSHMLLHVRLHLVDLSKRWTAGLKAHALPVTARSSSTHDVNISITSPQSALASGP